MRTVFLAIVLTFSMAAAAWQTAAPPQQVQQSVRILAPKAGDKLVNNFVQVSYEVAAPVSAASAPTFRLRLDNADPVNTTDTSYTFTGLTAGAHRVTVELVDANGTPIPGTLTQIEFNVIVGQSSPTRLPKPSSRVKEAGGKFQQTSLQNAEDRGDLPQTGSALPLLSVIGLGVLIGGLASALKITRQSN